MQNRLPGAKILLADCGLSEDARGLAQYLADRQENAALLDAKDIQLFN